MKIEVNCKIYTIAEQIGNVIYVAETSFVWFHVSKVKFL